MNQTETVYMRFHGNHAMLLRIYRQWRIIKANAKLYYCTYLHENRQEHYILHVINFISCLITRAKLRVGTTT